MDQWVEEKVAVQSGIADEPWRTLGAVPRLSLYQYSVPVSWITDLWVHQGHKFRICKIVASGWNFLRLRATFIVRWSWSTENERLIIRRLNSSCFFTVNIMSHPSTIMPDNDRIQDEKEPEKIVTEAQVSTATVSFFLMNIRYAGRNSALPYRLNSARSLKHWNDGWSCSSHGLGNLLNSTSRIRTGTLQEVTWAVFILLNIFDLEYSTWKLPYMIWPKFRQNARRF